MTANDIVQQALKKIGALAPGETATAEDADDGLVNLCLLIKGISGEGLLIPAFTSVGTTLVPGSVSFTIGKGTSPGIYADRPLQIKRAYIQDSSGYNYPVEIVDEETYLSIRTKTQTGRPYMIWYNPTHPNGEVFTYYSPDTAETIYLYSLVTLTQPTSLASDIEFPEPYDDLLIWNLAMYLAPDFGVQPNPLVVQRARDSKLAMKRVNAANRVKQVPMELARSIWTSRSIYEG